MSTLFSQKLLNHNEIRPLEADFTEVLGSIAVTPKMLYFYGKMPENRVSNVDFSGDFGDFCASGADSAGRPRVLAVVGTRRPTRYGLEIARKLAYEAAKRGAVVVSGMAYGIDAAAHRGALEAGGITVAVLGTPIDQIYPRAHVGLAEKIVATGGCVMSELAPGVEFFPKTSFLERNRLISGLADVVVVPEAAERSGSLNTAAHALEQGREVFAAPGDITRPLSRGTNRLIRQGAQPYLEPEDVLRVLFPAEYAKKARAKQAKLLFGDNALETGILRLIAAGVEDGEEILAGLNKAEAESGASLGLGAMGGAASEGVTAEEFSRALTMLELKGRIRGIGMDKWGLG